MGISEQNSCWGDGFAINVDADAIGLDLIPGWSQCDSTPDTYFGEGLVCLVLDYDGEASIYDAARGGEPRALAAADAIDRLLPENTRTVVDVACGTGIVTRRLRRSSRDILGVDRSSGMRALAADRLLAVVLADARCLPLGSAGLDAVVIVWLLQLLDDAAPVIAEAARVLRPGGVLVTTVDKDQGAFAVSNDIAALTARLRRIDPHSASDRMERVLNLARQHGMKPCGETSFVGFDQGRSPRHWREQVLAGRLPWARTAAPQTIAQLAGELAALPDQELARPDPVYRLILLTAR